MDDETALKTSKLTRQLQMVAALLRSQPALSLSTVDEHGEPCIAPLNYIADDNLSLYWLSSGSSQHSLNVKLHPAATVAVYRPAEYWREICGVQMRGKVAGITHPQLRRLLVKQYRERFQLGAVFGLAISRSALYSFTPEFIRYIDNSRRLGYRFELDLTKGNSSRSKR